MTTSVWRLAHLILAIFSFIFILMASVTGAILAFEPLVEKSNPYKNQNFDALTLHQVIPNLKNKYPELLDLSVDENQFVTIQGFDAEGNDFLNIVDPKSGTILAEPLQQSAFFQWVTSLHRSLFLHETGRFIIGFVSFLLFLIAVSGTFLIIKRQQGLKNFFNKVTKDFFAQFYHVYAGRLLLIPILIISLTGTYLFLLRFNVIQNPDANVSTNLTIPEMEQPLEMHQFPAFNSIYLKEVVKIEFPFDVDPAEFYKIKLVNKEVLVSQFSGEIIQTTHFSNAEMFKNWSLDLHTGRTNSVWAIVLGLASINLLFFIWSGFVMTYKRTKTKWVKNKIAANQAEIILFVGSENGASLTFANKIFNQLISQEVKVYICALNQYQQFEKAKHFVFLTSTYGMGEPPSNAKKFQKLLDAVPQTGKIQYSVVGFGSKAYKDFCAFAYRVDQWLSTKTWAQQALPVFTVNDKSPIEFANWITHFNQVARLKLYASPDFYAIQVPKLKPFVVHQKTAVFKNDATFTVTFNTKQKFHSGDLLAIYPANDYKERLYSIGKVNGKLQLVVKLHEFGLGSQFLYQLKANATINARLVKNANFHFPSAAKQVIFIANGTGIAPFLGMIDENIKNIETHLYAGFRHKNETTSFYKKFAEQNQLSGKLTTFQFAFSKESQQNYVMDLLKQDATKIATILQNGGIIMVCGAVAMQKDVETVLNQIGMLHNNKNFATYVDNGQFLTDCY